MNPKTFQLQSMKWGLVPFWTKRAPDYTSQLKTINCRDDSLVEDRGMWTSMKRYKRCIVVAQGFYEWLKKNNGKEKIPHYIKRKDGQLMLMAGLWDCVQYEGSEDKLYSYTIITTHSNKQLEFLHDRMPVILNPDSEAIYTWLDTSRIEWSNILQNILQPFAGELEIYPVAKEVGKVGNNSPTFIVPINSKENKNNIANFFSKAKPSGKETSDGLKSEIKTEMDALPGDKTHVGHGDHDIDSSIKIKKEHSQKDNARMPAPQEIDPKRTSFKREHSNDNIPSPPHKAYKTSIAKKMSGSPQKPARKLRSATTNSSSKKTTSNKGTGSQKITNFFGK